MPRMLHSWLKALEQRHESKYSGTYAAARERLEAKLLAMPHDGPDLSEEEAARVVASLLTELRAHIAERKAR